MQKQQQLDKQNHARSISEQPKDSKGETVPVAQIDEIMKKVDKKLDNYNMFTWGNRFQYIPLNPKQISSVFVANNPYFQDCLQLIDIYNQEIIECSKINQEIKNGPWKYKFYNTLFDLLRQVIFTRDRLLQKEYSQKVNVWAYEQICKLSTFDKTTQLKLSALNTTTFELNGNNSGQSRPFSGSGTGMNILGGTDMFPSVRPGAQNSVKQRGTSGGLDVTATTGILDSSQNVTAKSFLQDTSMTMDQQKSFSQMDINKLPPSLKKKEILKDYRMRSRTKHDDCDPPDIRLQDYKRRILSMEDPANLMTKQQEKKENSKIYYPKPTGYLQMKEEEQKLLQDLQKPGEQKPEELKQEGAQGEQQQQKTGEGEQKTDVSQEQKQGDIQEGVDKGDSEDGSQKQDNASEKGVGDDGKVINKMIPNNKAFVKDEYGQDKFINNLNQKFDVRSNYLYYKPSDDIREINMEAKWLYNRNKEVSDKRQEEEMITIMKQWSHSKGKVEKEINRKIESQMFGSQFQKCCFKPKIYTDQEVKNIMLQQNQQQQQPITQIKHVTINENQQSLIINEQKEKDEKDEQDGQSDEQEQDVEDGEQENSQYEYYQDENSQSEISQQNANQQKNQSNESEQSPAIGGRDINDGKKQQRRKARSFFVEGNAKKQRDFSGGQYIVAKSQNLPKESLINKLENKISKKRIEQALKIHGALINLKKKEDEDQKPVYLPSLSVYAKPQPNYLRPFSAIFDKNSPEIIKNQQLDEIQEIKNRMAQHKINVPIKILMESMLVPDGLPQDKLNNLPELGAGLIENPFFKKKKKKKKKGKKKK